jgi:hypothetical protein
VRVLAPKSEVLALGVMTGEREAYMLMKESRCGPDSKAPAAGVSKGTVVSIPLLDEGERTSGIEA